MRSPTNENFVLSVDQSIPASKSTQRWTTKTFAPAVVPICVIHSFRESLHASQTSCGALTWAIRCYGKRLMFVLTAIQQLPAELYSRIKFSKKSNTRLSQSRRHVFVLAHSLVARPTIVVSKRIFIWVLTVTSSQLLLTGRCSTLI